MLEILSFGIVIQILINGVLLGAMYGIAAIGLSLIFGTMQIIFLAQGTIIILLAYLCYWLFTLYSIDPYLSILIVVPVSLLLGVGLYQALFRKVAASEDKKISLLIAVGLLILVESLISVIWTADPRSINTSYTGSAITGLGLVVDFTGLIGLVLAVLSTIGVTLFLKKTLVGKAVRAASENVGAATLVGIAPNRVNAVAFAVGIGLAGIAGIATATTWPFDPYYGFIFSLKAMIALALGGINSIVGALIGGIILGVIESTASFAISGGWSDAISYAVFLVVLMFRPEGLFAR